MVMRLFSFMHLGALSPGHSNQAFQPLHPCIRPSFILPLKNQPSILSKYRVHGFPTLFLLNSTTRIRYGGSRTFNSLSSFYSDVTGIKPYRQHRITLNNTECPLKQTKGKDIEQENCPFSWARSPENLFRQETYLALATAFVLLRGVYLIFPYLLAKCQNAHVMGSSSAILNSGGAFSELHK